MVYHPPKFVGAFALIDRLQFIWFTSFSLFPDKSRLVCKVPAYPAEHHWVVDSGVVGYARAVAVVNIRVYG
jgi:hypothetical protein